MYNQIQGRTAMSKNTYPEVIIYIILLFETKQSSHDNLSISVVLQQKRNQITYFIRFPSIMLLM